MRALAIAIGLSATLCSTIASAQQRPVWYWCEPAKAYYPYVSTCSLPWREIPAVSVTPNTPTPQASPASEPPKSVKEPTSPKASAPLPISPRIDDAKTPPLPTPTVSATQQAIEAAKAADADRERKLREATEARAAEDEAAGFTRMSLIDFLVDYKTMSSGTKVITTGFHESVGDIDVLTAGAPAYGQQIYIDIAGLSRETRRTILQCHTQQTVCRMTVYAHTGCKLTSFGQETAAPCLVVDGVAGGTYDSPGRPIGH